MNTAALLAYAGAIFCGAVALAVIWNERRSVVHLAFVAGMVLLVLCLLATRFSFRTLKQYVIWHFTVLRNV